MDNRTQLLCATALIITPVAAATTLLALDRLGQGMGLLLFLLTCLGLIGYGRAQL